MGRTGNTFGIYGGTREKCTGKRTENARINTKQTPIANIRETWGRGDEIGNHGVVMAEPSGNALQTQGVTYTEIHRDSMVYRTGEGA